MWFELKVQRCCSRIWTPLGVGIHAHVLRLKQGADRRFEADNHDLEGAVQVRTLRTTTVFGSCMTCSSSILLSSPNLVPLSICPPWTQPDILSHSISPRRFLSLHTIRTHPSTKISPCSLSYDLLESLGIYTRERYLVSYSPIRSMLHTYLRVLSRSRHTFTLVHNADNVHHISSPTSPSSRSLPTPTIPPQQYTQILPPTTIFYAPTNAITVHSSRGLQHPDSAQWCDKTTQVIVFRRRIESSVR